jgi:arylsulfatase A-like enzyme
MNISAMNCLILRRFACVPLVLAAWASLLSSSASAAARPNVIVMLSDDQGYGDFSCHGNPVLKTPNLDKLHDESIRLTDFHVAPMCTPTRGQLMTGQDALHNGASSVSAGRSFIRRRIPTMAEIFKAGGYRTAMFGKWHLGDSYPHLPDQRGFEEAVYLRGWGITSIADLWQNDCFDGSFRNKGKLQKYPGYCTDVWFDLAKNWMRERAKDTQPFFLYLPTNAPHGPCWVADKYREPYLKRGPANFFGMIANIDENVGKLEAFLAESGLRDNTIVIYMHDNGGTAGVKLFNAGMRGQKTTYYEGGHRAACFLRWPGGKLRQPGDVDNLTEIQDLLPTLIDLCGLKRPLSTQFDGTNLADLLRGTTTTLPDRKLVVQYGQVPTMWDSAVMWNKWRLVQGKELYDVASDPGQDHDVADKYPEIVGKMRNYYESWWAGVAPKLQDFSPISVGAPQENPVTLTAADWMNVYCDNMRDVRDGAEKNGAWRLLVEQDGQYEIRLRRWPQEADAPMTAAVPEFKAVVGGLPPGKALPIASARLKIGDFDETQKVGSGDKEIKFTLTLKAGTKVPMQSWLYDAQGKELCGAYFAYVQRARAP